MTIACLVGVWPHTFSGKCSQNRSNQGKQAIMLLMADPCSKLQVGLSHLCTCCVVSITSSARFRISNINSWFDLEDCWRSKLFENLLQAPPSRYQEMPPSERNKAGHTALALFTVSDVKVKTRNPYTTKYHDPGGSWHPAKGSRIPNSNKVVVVTTLQCQVIFGRFSLNQKHQLVVISSYHLIIPYAQHVFLLPLLGGWKTIRHNKKKTTSRTQNLSPDILKGGGGCAVLGFSKGTQAWSEKSQKNDGMMTTSCLEFKMMHMHSIHLCLKVNIDFEVHELCKCSAWCLELEGATCQLWPFGNATYSCLIKILLKLTMPLFNIVTSWFDGCSMGGT